MKAEPWARFCSYWWLVVADPSLVSGLDVPEAWGIMSPPSGRRTRTMTVVRQAPKLKPADTGPAWRRIASWEHFRLTNALHDAEWRVESHKRDAERARHELAERDLAGEGRASPHAANIGRILAELDQRRYEIGGLDVEAVVQAITDLKASRLAVRRAQDEVRYIAEEVRRLLDPPALSRIAHQLEDLSKRTDAERAA